MVPILIRDDGHKPKKESPDDRKSDPEQAGSGPEPEMGRDEKGHQNATCQPSSERLKIQGKQNP